VKKLIKRFLKFCLKLSVKIIPKKIKSKVKNYLIANYSRLQFDDINYNDNCLHIAILLNGGFGDVLISSAWIKELYRRIDCAVEIDIFAHPNHHCLFYLVPYKVRFFRHELYNNAAGYDLKLQIAHFIKIDNWQLYRIIDKDKKLYELLVKINDFNNKYRKYCDEQPFLDGEWAALMVKLGRNRWSELNIDGLLNFDSSKGFLNLDINKYRILNKLGLLQRNYITIHLGSDVNWNKNSTKLWLAEYYIELVELIKKQYNDLIIVQLGAGINSIPINNVDVNCLDKLDMQESIIILKHSLLHIDCESGLVHIKRQLNGKSIVLFGPTPIEFFKYKRNININSPFSCTGCMWMLNDWNIRCVYTGLEYPSPCMKAITSQMVMAEFKKYIDVKFAKKTTVTQTDLEIYSTTGLKKYDPILTDMCNVFNIEKLPISEHIFSGIEKFYIHATKQWEYPYAIDKIKKYTEQRNRINKEIKIADIGGGAGLLSPYLALIGYDTTVYDINYKWDHNGNPEQTEKLRLRWAENNGLKMEYGSIFNIPAKDETYDIVTCISVVEHVPEKYFAFKEMLRVLKPGGILIDTYDLINPDREIYKGDSLRVEIFTPELINEILSVLGVKTIQNHTSEDIQKSLNDMRKDNVNIPEGIVAGGFVLKKGEL